MCGVSILGHLYIWAYVAAVGAGAYRVAARTTVITRKKASICGGGVQSVCRAGIVYGRRTHRAGVYSYGDPYRPWTACQLDEHPANTIH